MRDATQAEVGRLKGEVYAMAGDFDAAANELVAPYIRKETDADLLAAIGLNELRRGENARAMKFLQAAVDGKTARSRAWMELARLHLAAALEPESNPEGVLPVASVKRILTLLYGARERPPLWTDTYELVAEVWRRSAVPPKRGHLNILEEGVSKFPRRVPLIMDVAELFIDCGFVADAVPYVDLGLKLATAPADRERLEALRAGLAQ
jgi:hypothetical protein